MKKIYSFILAAILCCTSNVWAGELTVADGTKSNNCVPYDGYSGDYFQRVQIIYPQSELSEMAGKDITSLTFYVNSKAPSALGVKVQIGLAEISDSDFSAGKDYKSATLTIVKAEDVWDLNAETVVVEFSKPFSYSGEGSILFDLQTVAIGGYGNTSFYGVGSLANYQSAYSYAESSIPATSSNRYKFIPKTTFTYEEPAPATPKAYSSGTVALKDLIVGDTLMAGVTLTDDADKAVFFVENRSAMNGSTMSSGGLFNGFTSMLTSPLLGDNASFSLLQGMTVTPINEEGNAGSAWVVVEGYPELAAVYLAGIGTQEGGEPEPQQGIVCTAEDLDKVLCSDGSIYENVAAATAASKTAVAMIASINTTTNKVVAIALADEAGTMDWETAQSTCAAKTAVAGVAWTVLSLDQIFGILEAHNGGEFGYYIDLNTTIANVGGTSIPTQIEYWTKDEFKTTDGVCFHFDADEDFIAAGFVEKATTLSVRACLEFDLTDPVPTAVENVQTNPAQATKFFRDGQLLIEKNGKIYNVMGAEVK